VKISTRINKVVITSVFIAIFAAALVYGIVKTEQFPRCTVDDAFILFRYAENLAEHGELNWNPGENPVEGYTGFTLVMIISAAIKLGISPIAASQAIGITFFFIGGILILLILRGFNIGSVTASILYFTTPFMFVHAWSGLETTLFTTAILFALYAFTLGRNKLFVSSLLLLSFTRPEGVLLSALLLAVYRPLSKPIIAAYLAPCIAYFLWRWIYYGQLLPNTFYAKASYSAPLQENVNSLRLLASNYLRMPALLCLIFFSYEHARKRKLLIGVVLAFGLISLGLYLRSDLVMNYAYRFFVPLYVLALLAVGGILLGTKTNLKTLLIAAAILTSCCRHVTSRSDAT
jgi:arabinofuranosyltransferase